MAFNNRNYCSGNCCSEDYCLLFQIADSDFCHHYHLSRLPNNCQTGHLAPNKDTNVEKCLSSILDVLGSYPVKLILNCSYCYNTAKIIFLSKRCASFNTV